MNTALDLLLVQALLYSVYETLNHTNSVIFQCSLLYSYFLVQNTRLLVSLKSLNVIQL